MTPNGLYLYFDCQGDECRQVDDDCAEASLLLEVRDGIAAVVHPEDEDAGLEIPVDQLTGVLEPLKRPPRPLAGPVFEYLLR